MSFSEDPPVFKPKLLSDVSVKFLKKDERGEFYIMGGMGRKDHLKIHGVGKDIVEMLDGNTSVGEIEERLRRREIEIDVKRFIDLLGKKGFLENSSRSERRRGTTSTMLIHYIPMFKRTEHVLKGVHWILRGAFRRRPIMLLVAMNLAVFCAFLFSLALGFVSYTDFFFLGNSFSLALTVYILVIAPTLVAIHEFSHALMCFHYGGQPQEMGIGLFVFMPFFYADTSDTWMLNKRQSIFVFLAGPLSTFLIGNACFLLSFLFSQPYVGLLRMVAFGSYFAVLYGFAPVVESDGYLILQSLTDFPNLISHGRKYVPLWFKKKLGRLSGEGKEQMESYSKRELRILAFYAPVTFMITAVFVVIAGYWGALFFISYHDLILTFKATYPNVAFFDWINFGLQTFYLVLIATFPLSMIMNYRNSRTKNRAQ